MVKSHEGAGVVTALTGLEGLVGALLLRRFGFDAALAGLVGILTVVSASAFAAVGTGDATGGCGVAACLTSDCALRDRAGFGMALTGGGRDAVKLNDPGSPTIGFSSIYSFP